MRLHLLPSLVFPAQRTFLGALAFFFATVWSPLFVVTIGYYTQYLLDDCIRLSTKIHGNGEDFFCTHGSVVSATTLGQPEARGMTRVWRGETYSCLRR